VSTNWYLVCTSHEPNLGSDYFYTRPDQLVKDLERRETIVGLPDWVMEQISTDEWSDTKAWHWLRQHATCDVEIYNEYGKSLDRWNAENAWAEEIKKRQQDAGHCTLLYGPYPYKVCRLLKDHEGEPHDMVDAEEA